MTPSERVTIHANAVMDGMNCVLHLQSLRGAPPTVRSEEVESWREVLAKCNDALEIERKGELDGRSLWTSRRPSEALIAAIEDVRARLSAAAPGAPLPSSFFDLVDVTWDEFRKTIP